MSESTHPEEHLKALRETIGRVLYERRNWPWPESARTGAQALSAKIRAEAPRAACLPALRERVARLTEQLETARLELGRAGIEADQAAGAVRGVMLAGGDVDAAERHRDDLGAKVERLRTRVADLTAASEQATDALADAEKTALEVAAGKRLADARAAYDRASEATDALYERFVTEFAAALYAETEAQLTVSAARKLAGYTGALPANRGDYEPVPEDEVGELEPHAAVVRQP